MNRDLNKGNGKERELVKKNYVDLILTTDIKAITEKNNAFSMTCRKPFNIKSERNTRLDKLNSLPSLEIGPDHGNNEKGKLKGIDLVKPTKFWSGSGKGTKSVKNERRTVVKSDDSLGIVKTSLGSPCYGVGMIDDFPKPQRGFQGYKFSTLNTNRNIVKSNYIRKIFN